VQMFSALKRVGIDEANDKIIELLGLHDEGAEDAEDAPDDQAPQDDTL
jgi:GTP-binding protein